ncbi:MAG: MMPL family transporter, partial [Myxococcales bacterium]|nr:MMPL family transporter [Myxococcales bacterium]
MQVYRLPLWLASWSVRRPWLVLLFSGLISCFAGFLALKLELHNDLVELLPATMPQVKTIRRIIKETGGLGVQAVVVQSPDPKKNRAFLEAVRATLLRKSFSPEMTSGYQPPKSKDAAPPKKSPLISYAFWGYDIEALRKKQLYFLSIKDLREVQRRIQDKVRYEVRKRQPGYVDLLGGDDPGLDLKDIEKKYDVSGMHKTGGVLEVREGDQVYSALLIRPNGNQTDLIFARYFVSELRATVASLKPEGFHREMKVQLMGSFTNAVHEFYGISRDLAQTGILTAVLLLLMLLAFFRQFRALWLLGIPLGMGALWAFAFAYVWIGYLTTATGFIGVVILGLGIDYGVYFLQRFSQEYDETGDFTQSIETCYLWTGKAIATSAFTTAMAFLSLIVCRFTGFSQFGVIASVGVLCCLLTMNMVLPALLTLENRWKPRLPRNVKHTKDYSDLRPFGFSRVWLGVSLLLILSIGYSFSRVPFEYHLKKLSFQDRGLVEHEREWKRFEHLYPMQNMNPIVYLMESEKEARHLVDKLNKMSKNWSSYRDDRGRQLIKGAFSALSFVPEQQAEKYKILQDLKSFLQKRNIEDWVEGDIKKTYQRYKEMLEAKPYDVRELPNYVRNDLVLTDKKDPRKIRGYLVVVQSGADYSNGRMV